MVQSLSDFEVHDLLKLAYPEHIRSNETEHFELSQKAADTVIQLGEGVAVSLSELLERVVLLATPVASSAFSHKLYHCLGDFTYDDNGHVQMKNIAVQREFVKKESRANLLEETLVVMNAVSKTPDQIEFIGSLETCHECTWEEFKVLANVEYNNKSQDSVKVADDLIIVFKDGGKLCRACDTRSEWWTFVPMLTRRHAPKKITCLVSDDVIRATLTVLN